MENVIITDNFIEQTIDRAFKAIPMAGEPTYLTSESPAATDELSKLLIESCDELGEYRALKELAERQKEVGEFRALKELEQRYKNFI